MSEYNYEGIVDPPAPESTRCPPHKFERKHYFLLTDSPKAGKTVGQCLRKVRVCKICKGVFAN